jgi:hypothetical protein
MKPCHIEFFHGSNKLNNIDVLKNLMKIPGVSIKQHKHTENFIDVEKILVHETNKVYVGLKDIKFYCLSASINDLVPGATEH